MLSKDEALGIIQKVGSMTKFYAAVEVNANEEGTTRFANSEITQNVSVADTTVSLTLCDGKKEAQCATNVWTDDGLKKLVRDAEAILPLLPDGEFDAVKYANTPVPESRGDDSLANAFGVDERVEHIRKGISKLESGSTAAGALALTREFVAKGDNDGAFHSAWLDYLAFNTVVTYDADAAGAGQTCAHTLNGVDIQSEFDKAIVTAKAARNPVSVDVGAYTVVLSPLAFGDLISYVSMMHNAKALEDGYSYAIGNMGKKVFGENITIRDDVNFSGTLPYYFDLEGNARKPLTLVDKGTVNALMHSSLTARRMNAAVTGHAHSNKNYGGFAFNLVVEGGGSSVAEMIAGVEKGIYINEFHYTNAVNYRNLQITGLTRNGTFLIENGKLGPAITTMRFTQGLIESLNAVTALSKTLERVPEYNCVYMMPAARIENFHFTSRQQ